MIVDSKQFKVLSLTLFFSLPLVMVLSAFGLSQRVQQTWRTFAMVCSKSWDLMVGYIFYFDNFWSILIIGLFSLALSKGLIYLIRQVCKSYILKKKFNQKILFNQDGASVVDDLRLFAVTVGWFKPRIYLSSALVASLTDQELTAVITHESYHQSNKHPLFLLMINSLKSFLFFFPVLRNVTSYVSLKYEVLADQLAIAKTSKAALSLALLKIIDQGKNLSFPETVATFSTTRDRVNVLIDDVSPVLRVSRFLMIVSIVMGMLISFTIFGVQTPRVDASDILLRGSPVDVSVECYSPTQSIMLLVTFGQQSEANMTYDLDLKMNIE